MTLDHTDPEFHPLDHSQLNDNRRRIVENEEISDDELRHSIQTFLYHDRELAMKLSKKSKPPKEAKLDPSVNFDDLLNEPVDPSNK